MQDAAPSRCYVQMRLLPETCRPAYVVRHRGVTLIAIDPRSTRGEFADWAPGHLLRWERDVCRRAYGMPPIEPSRPLVEQPDLPVVAVVPAPLRYPGPAIPAARLVNV